MREFSLDSDPPWVIDDVLLGVPVPATGELGPGGPRFRHTARMMGELLASFRGLPVAGLQLGDLWADPQRLAAAAARWAAQLGVSAARCSPKGPAYSPGAQWFSPMGTSRRSTS